MEWTEWGMCVCCVFERLMMGSIFSLKACCISCYIAKHWRRQRRLTHGQPGVCGICLACSVRGEYYGGGVGKGIPLLIPNKWIGPIKLVKVISPTNPLSLSLCGAPLDLPSQVGACATYIKTGTWERMGFRSLFWLLECLGFTLPNGELGTAPEVAVTDSLFGKTSLRPYSHPITIMLVLKWNTGAQKYC